MRKIIISLLISIVVLFCLTGCNKKENTNINSKLDAELEYIEDIIFKITNKYAKGEYVEGDKFKWDEIKPDVQKINDAWNILILDLTEIKVQNKDIMDFSNDLDNLFIVISKQDEVEMINRLNSMYTKIIAFKDAYTEDKNKIQKNKIKNDVLTVFSFVNNNDYITAHEQIINTIDTYKGMMNDINYAKENSYNLNKIYVLLEEYKMSIQTQNYDLARMKYIVTVENL